MLSSGFRVFVSANKKLLHQDIQDSEPHLSIDAMAMTEQSTQRRVWRQVFSPQIEIDDEDKCEDFFSYWCDFKDVNL